MKILKLFLSQFLILGPFDLVYAEVTPAPTPPISGLLAAWSQAGGTYADSTDQTFRYSISNGVVTDALTSMQWEHSTSNITMDWSSVPIYCAARSTGGFGDWRAPNIGELQTLIDYTIVYPAPPINAVAFPNTPTSSFWSSTPVVGMAGNSWDLQFSSSSWPSLYYWDTVATLDEIRCVRSSYPIPSDARYTIASDAVTDTVTGLIWQQVSIGSMSQTNAFISCAGLNLAGFSSGWRLPTVKELLTLVDYSISQGNLMMDVTAFPGEPSDWFWSSSSVEGYPTRAWLIHFGHGSLTDGRIVANDGDVRCVHYGITQAPVPTTSAPTTSIPTTPVPTTSAPTTHIPTTMVPSTQAPTTLAPTTSIPTTLEPTTSIPTTLEPTTTVSPASQSFFSTTGGIVLIGVASTAGLAAVSATVQFLVKKYMKKHFGKKPEGHDLESRVLVNR